MEKKETLRQYLTYNRDVNEINEIFVNLDRQLKYLHQRGYCVSDLNSDSIVLEKNKNSSPDDQNIFMFSSITRTSNGVRDYSDNVVSLSKIAIGAFMSVENGFCDYSQLSTDYIRKYFGEISMYLPNSEYFSRVIQDDDISYYSDYIQMRTGNSRNNTIQKRKATEYGKMYVPEEDAAFIQIVFYPVVIISIITVIAVLSKMIN
ncbi:MAG: hypothetical protein IJO43_01010 [Bacilli bacterium]|nr:hypothetical protein [Bacilli bacterium]